VRLKQGDLPPAVDLEFEPHGKRPPEKKRFLAELSAFDKKVSAVYGYPPIYYLNEDFYRYYFERKPIKKRLWVRGIYHKPAIMKKFAWTFWQYNDFGRVEGIKGRVDLNVFNGNSRDFETLRGLRDVVR
jgi:lysozyme